MRFVDFRATFSNDDSRLVARARSFVVMRAFYTLHRNAKDLYHKLHTAIPNADTLIYVKCMHTKQPYVIIRTYTYHFSISFFRQWFFFLFLQSSFSISFTLSTDIKYILFLFRASGKIPYKLHVIFHANNDPVFPDGSSSLGYCVPIKYSCVSVGTRAQYK